MQVYANNGGDSNVLAFENGGDYIIVQFSSGTSTHYKYTYVSAGMSVIETMKRLAHSGEGLNEYISRNRPMYSEKW